jgi:hypothetical protein
MGEGAVGAAITMLAARVL